MRVVSITSLKIFLTFLLGILGNYFYEFKLSYLHLSILIAFLVLLLIWVRSRKQLFQDLSFGIVTYLSLFLIGAWVYQIHQPIHHVSHYTQHMTEKDTLVFQLKIREGLKPDLYNTKYIAKVTGVSNEKVSGKILLLIPKDSNSIPLKVDELLLVKTNLRDIPKPKNPFQFDYASHMRQKGIYHQLQLKKEDIFLIKYGKTTIRGVSAKVRDAINRNLKEHGLEGNSLGLINALLLGQRQELSQEVYSDFAAAGAVHILAVSGLHVGILMLLLRVLFKPLERLQRGNTIKIVAIVLCLWAFACITGLSPSVLRAVTMFSFLAYALESNRETSTVNTLLASAFLLLLLEPNLIFQVGFQMSYLAVFAIVWIQPKLAKLYSPKTYIDKLLWGILTVTMAAQLGVGPLSIYYFNYFPGLFFITNLVVLPFLGILLGGGIFIILLASLNLLPDFLTETYATLLESLVQFIGWVAKQDTYYFEDLTLTKGQLLLFYVLIIAIVVCYHKLTFHRLAFLLLSVLCLQGIYIFEKVQTNYNELVIFHKSRNTILGLKNGNELKILTSLDTSKVYKEKFLINYKMKAKIRSLETDSIKNIFSFNSNTVVVIDSMCVYPRGIRNIDVLVLSQSPPIHLERLIDSLQPKTIVADGSNYTTYVQRWRKTCKKRNLPFHHTGSEGAFVLK